MRAVTIDGIDYIIVWDGRRVEAPAPEVLAVEPWGPEESHQSIAARILALLHEQEEWTTKELQAEAGIQNKALHTALQNLRRNGRTVHPRSGVVRLVQSTQAAA